MDNDFGFIEFLVEIKRPVKVEYPVKMIKENLSFTSYGFSLVNQIYASFTKHLLNYSLFKRKNVY